jgi:hypothetical protein
MCLSEETSWITLAVGSIVNGIVAYRLSFSAPEAVPVVAIWQFALLMQLPEAFEWRAMRLKKPPSEAAAKTAMVLNVLQPIATYVGLLVILRMTGKRLDTFRGGMATAAVSLYAVLMTTHLIVHRSTTKSIRNLTGCAHLNLGWWFGISGALYVCASLLIQAALPSHILVPTMVTFVLTLVISMRLYWCGGPSMWCWMVASAPLILYSYLQML